MAGTRRIAVLFDPDAMDLRQRETLRGISAFAEAHGDWQVVLDPFGNNREHGHYDGLIASTRKGRGPSLARSPVPVVSVTAGHVHHQLVRVHENRYSAGRLAAQHFVEQGCRTFAYLGFAKQKQSSLEREQFALALRRLGHRIHRARTFVTFATSRAWWDKVMGSLGNWVAGLAAPAGLFVCRPGFARAVADLALRRGVRIPEDLAIVAADDDPTVCGLEPGLTAVRFDYAEVGRRAAEVLDGLMRGGPRPRRAVLVEPSLVPRRSTDRQAVGDPAVAKALWFIDSRRSERLSPEAMDLRGRRRDLVCPQDVAESVGLTLRVLEMRFRRARGRTVAQELARARVEHAKLLLRDPRLTMRAVAHESGFGSYGAMLRAFRQHAGLSPRAFRPEAEAKRKGGHNTSAE